MGKTKKTMINPIKLLGLCLFSSSFVYFGYELFNSDVLKSDAQRRLMILWNSAASQYPALADYNAQFAANAHHVITAMMYALLTAPMLIFCRYCSMFTILAFGLWSSLFFNPYV